MVSGVGSGMSFRPDRKWGRRRKEVHCWAVNNGLGGRGLPASQRDPTRKNKASDAHPKPLWPFLLLLTTCGEGLTQPAFHPLFSPGKIPAFCEQLKSCLGKKANEIFLYFLTSHVHICSVFKTWDPRNKKILILEHLYTLLPVQFFKTIFLEQR